MVLKGYTKFCVRDLRFELQFEFDDGIFFKCFILIYYLTNKLLAMSFVHLNMIRL